MLDFLLDCSVTVCSNLQYCPNPAEHPVSVSSSTFCFSSLPTLQLSCRQQWLIAELIKVFVCVTSFLYCRDVRHERLLKFILLWFLSSADIWSRQFLGSHSDFGGGPPVHVIMLRLFPQNLVWSGTFQSKLLVWSVVCCVILKWVNVIADESKSKPKQSPPNILYSLRGQSLGLQFWFYVFRRKQAHPLKFEMKQS